MKPVYALSIKQPWAWLIVNGYKDVENRSWLPPIGLMSGSERIYIHAGAKPDGKNYNETKWITRSAMRLAGPNISDQVWCLVYLRREEYADQYGAIVGEATLFRTLDPGMPAKMLGPWFVGPVGLLLKDPVAYKTPIPCKGRLGFWKPQLEVADAP